MQEDDMCRKIRVGEGWTLEVNFRYRDANRYFLQTFPNGEDKHIEA